MFASAHGNNLRQDRNCDLIRRDHAKVKPCRRALSLARRSAETPRSASFAFSASAFLGLHSSLRTACGSKLLVDGKESSAAWRFSVLKRETAHRQIRTVSQTRVALRP